MGSLLHTSTGLGWTGYCRLDVGIAVLNLNTPLYIECFNYPLFAESGEFCGFSGIPSEVV